MQIAFVTTASRGLLADILSSLGVTVPESDRLRVDTLNFAFTGIRNGQSVSITMTFPQLFATKTMTLTGTLRGNTLTLTAPGSNGLLDTMVMPVGTADDYNRAVLTIQKRVAHANDLASQREAVIQAARAFGTARSRLSDDLDRLTSVTDFTSVFEAYRETLIEMRRDDATLRSDAAMQPFDCYQLGTVKYDLGTLEYDMGSIKYQNASFDSARRDVLSAVDAVHDDVAVIRRALQELQRAVQADTAKTASQQDVDQLEEQAQDDERTADQRVRAALIILQQREDQARGYNENATGLLEQARQYVASLSCAD
jgi:hypothetical protein